MDDKLRALFIGARDQTGTATHLVINVGLCILLCIIPLCPGLDYSLCVLWYNKVQSVYTWALLNI